MGPMPTHTFSPCPHPNQVWLTRPPSRTTGGLEHDTVHHGHVGVSHSAMHVASHTHHSPPTHQGHVDVLHKASHPPPQPPTPHAPGPRRCVAPCRARMTVSVSHVGGHDGVPGKHHEGHRGWGQRERLGPGRSVGEQGTAAAAAAVQVEQWSRNISGSSSSQGYQRQ